MRSLLIRSLLAVELLALGACRPRSEQRADERAPTVTLTVQSAPLPPVAPPPGAGDIASLVDRVKPSVVNITSTENVDLLHEWPFGGLWPIPPGESAEGQLKRDALGSGFIVDSTGYVVTNAHVVENAARVRVRLDDEREFDATVRGRDERLDLAVLRLVGAKDLKPVILGSSDSLRVGNFVIAIGNPFGLGHTVTTGIVSAKSRDIGAGPYDDFIQTDASINPGNSGGPLFNLRGEVVGINTAMAASAQGIGFAIPVDALKYVLPQLIETGHVARGRLGVAVKPVEQTLAKQLGFDRPRGALVAVVESASPADKAGIRTGDVITSVDGVPIAHASELARVVARHPPNSRVSIEVIRGGSSQQLEVTLDELKSVPRGRR
jgi:serine protease Do